MKHSGPPRKFVAALVLLGACGAQPAAERGAALFSDPAFSAAPSNVFSCATCHHSDSATSASARSPGYPLRDVVQRPTYWGGAYDVLLDAVNECYASFMRGQRLTPDDEDGRALLAYLESISPSPSASALPLTVVLDIADLPKGDATRGEATYRAACLRCHGEARTGAGRIGTASLIPDSTIASFGTDPVKGARPITIEKVRHGKFFNIGGVMPFYSTEALSDAELADILTYLGLDL